MGELIFDLFLTSSNNLTATVESNAATEKKKILGASQCHGIYVLNLFKQAAIRNHALPTEEGSGSLSAWNSLTFELDKVMGLTPMTGGQYTFFRRGLSLRVGYLLAPRVFDL